MEIITKKFIKYLKERKIHHYVCTKCGYSQGHPIVYCPKCPHRMVVKEETQYEHFIRNEDVINSVYYKHLCSNDISWIEWREIIDNIKGGLS